MWAANTMSVWAEDNGAAVFPGKTSGPTYFKLADDLGLSRYARGPLFQIFNAGLKRHEKSILKL